MSSRTSGSALASLWAPVAVLLLGAACTAAVTRQVAAATRAREQRCFEKTARGLQSALQQRVARYRKLAGATSAMIAGDDGYTGPATFREHLGEIRPSDYAGVESVGYCRWFQERALAEFVPEARRWIDPAFELVPGGPPRREYFPILLVGPDAGPNRRLIGYDLFTDPACRAAIELARDSGAPAQSAALRAAPTARSGEGAAQGTAASPAGPAGPRVLIFSPVYKKDAQPTSPESRRLLLRGVSYVAVRLSDLFDASDVDSVPTRPAGVEFAIQDGVSTATETAPGGFPGSGAAALYQSPGYESAAGRPSPLTAVLPITVADRSWALTTLGTPAFGAGTDAGRVLGAPVLPAIAAGGMAITLMLAGLLWLQRRARVAARVAKVAADRLDLALEAAGVGLWYYDLPSGRLRWDERAKALFFLSGEQEITTDAALVRAHPDDRERVRAAMDRSIREAAPFEVEYRTVSPDGARTNWLRSVGKPIADSGGNALRFDVLTTDVTALKLALEQAEATRELADRSREQAEGTGRVKDEFLATLSHELRTPLNAILGWTQLLRRQQDLEASVDEGLVVIERNARVQSQLVADLLDMSRIVSGKIRLDVQPVDLEALSAAAVESARPAADAKGITLERVTAGIPDAAALCVWGDAARLQQVAWNLLTNAVKFTPDGGRVRIAVARAAGPSPRVTLTVTDTGEGIAAAFLPHLFDRFTQADAGTTRRHGGLGLGLAVVKHLVELHGGRVWAASEGPGAGSTFTVELPAAQPRPASEVPGTPAGPPVEGRIVPALGGLTVLVVDDEPDARDLVRRVLGEAGASVLLASGAEDAVCLLRERRPDVLVSDIGMPGRDGFALARAVRALPPGQGGTTPAVALTAFAAEEDGRRALAAGFQVHLPKPAEADDLVAVVARLAGRGAPAGVTESAPAAPPRSAGAFSGGGPSRPEITATRRERLGLDE